MVAEMTFQKTGGTIRLGLVAVMLALGGGPVMSAPLPQPLRAADTLALTRPADAVAALEQFAATPEAVQLPLQRAALLRLRRAHLDLGDYPAARKIGERLRALGQKQHDPVSLAYAALTDIDEQVRGWEPDYAKAGLERITHEVKLDTAPDLEFSVHMAYGRIHLLQADYERAIGQFQSGMDLAARTEQPTAAQVEALINLSYTYMFLHDVDGAERMVNTALDANLAQVPARIRALLHIGHAIVLIERARMDEADQAFGEALKISRDSSLRVIEARALADRADLALRRERFVDAERIAREALRAAEAIDDVGSVITARANIGFGLGGQGRLEEGLVFIDGVIEHFRKQGNDQSLLSMLDEKGMLLQRLGRFEATVAVLREQQKLEREQFTAQRSKAVAALQERFDRDQNLRRIELLQEQNRVKDVVIRNRDLQRVALGLAVLLTLAVVGLVGLLYRRARKSNTLLHEMNTRLAEHAVRDPLTGLHNRRSFAEKFQARAARSVGERQRDAGPTGSTGEIFMVLDLDHFKQVNDTHGHAAGDAVLVEVARRLQLAVRDSDSVLRWGGEEFVIHSASVSTQQGAALARRVLDAVGGSPIETGAASLNVTVSAGMVELPFAGLSEANGDWQRALRLADSALYLAKRAGRNRCVQLTPGTATLTLALADLERDLEAAANAGQIALHTILPSATAAG
jgi:diguanylate cyclase (GGDEF)-like protein